MPEAKEGSFDEDAYQQELEDFYFADLKMSLTSHYRSAYGSKQGSAVWKNDDDLNEISRTLAMYLAYGRKQDISYPLRIKFRESAMRQS